MRTRRGMQFRGVDAGDVHGIEEAVIGGDAGPLESGGEQCREAMGATGDPAQAIRAVIDRVHAGHDREQHLRGADIRGRFFAADMLLAGL